MDMFKRQWFFVTLFMGLAAGALMVTATRSAPLRVLTGYPVSMLVEEMQMMADCAQCHSPDTFHTCSTCHDDHGAVEMLNVPFYAGITLEGDVPAPGYVLLNEVLPYRDQPHTHVQLLDFLSKQGARDFESVTLASLDGGFVTMTSENLTGEALLMPYVDGIRFAAENLHVSTWVKGIRRVIVVGSATPLLVDGQATSMGRLLLGPTLELTVDSANVMLQSAEDGEIRRAQAGTRILGVPLSALVAEPAFRELLIRDSAGQEYQLSAEDCDGAVLAQFRGRVTLVLPERGRGQWISDVVALESR
jgi:hypothetical protein